MTSRRTIPAWIELACDGSGVIECLRCRAKDKMPVLASHARVIEWLEWFGEEHRNCPLRRAFASVPQQEAATP